jgi:hypothetical protein
MECLRMSVDQTPGSDSSPGGSHDIDVLTNRKVHDASRLDPQDIHVACVHTLFLNEVFSHLSGIFRNAECSRCCCVLPNHSISAWESQDTWYLQFKKSARSKRHTRCNSTPGGNHNRVPLKSYVDGRLLTERPSSISPPAQRQWANVRPRHWKFGRDYSRRVPIAAGVMNL